MKAKRILASVLSVALLLQLSPLGVLALDEGLPQTPQVSTMQENLDPAPTEEPALVAEPTPTAEPTPEETAAPTATPTPEPTAEPTATPAPEETAAPDAAETPAPEPSAEPTAAPDPAAEVQAMIDALPDKVTDDNAEAVAQALTDIDDAKESLTDDELAGLDLTRYDAAANALLALWGEAPADAVELLDTTYTEPGKDGDWYLINSEEKLRWFANEVSINGRTTINARLTDNILVDKTTQWTPIGTKTKPFTATFDGCNFTISGLSINDSNKDYVGLFGYVGENGTVKDVTLADSYVSGNERVGGICGYNKGGTLQGCHNTGTVSGTQSVGGVCGENRNSGIIQKCDNAGTVSGTEYSIGGVCGVNVANLNSTPTIQECYNTGTVSGADTVGGVCGKNIGGTVKKSYNIGTVSGSYTGGVCGWNENSSYSATVNGCYNTGTVSGATKVGGVCGYNQNSDTVTNCYYLEGTSANAFGDGSDGTNCASKTELQFQNGDVAYQLQSDLNITTQVWGQRIDGTGETDDHPVLNSTSAYTVHPAAPGSICKRYSNTPDQTFTEHAYDDKTRICSRCGESKPLEAVNGYYEIYNQDQLREFANLVNTTSDGETKINACLMNDITMDGTEWTPIGTDTISFTGTFEGQGYTISGLTCTDTNKDHVGLVGYAIDATIQNVTVQGATLNGRDYIGSVCGYLSGGTITNCHAVETVIGKTGREAQSKYRGGIVGYIIGNTNVTGCTNSGTVSGLNFLGGIVGQAQQATVQRCFNSGAVTGNSSPIGGIVGFANQATVQDCGNNGTVTRADSSGDCGGIAGSTNSTSSIQNCYNAYRTIAYPICASPSSDTTFLNCYYLADNPGTDPSAKTEAQFNSGEVAYLLQNGERTDTTTTVWGQTLTEPNKQNYPVLGGDKVYRSTPCPTDYTNTAQQTLDHSYTTGGVCSRCGEWQEAKQAADGYYEIHNQGQLRWFADQVNNNGRTDINARLMDDIKLNGDNKVLNDDGSLISDTSNLKSWTPIGKSGNSFKGEFDGNGHTIRGLYFNDTNKGDVGLFGFVGAGGTVKNVTLADSYVSGSWYVGGICGQNYGGTVEGCRNTGRVYGTRHYVGGVCGHNEGILQKSCNTGIVTGYEYVGGVCGFNVSNSGSQSTIQVF